MRYVLTFVAVAIAWAAPTLAQQEAGPKSTGAEVQQQGDQAQQHQQSLQDQQTRQQEEQKATAGQESRKHELSGDHAVKQNQPPEPEPQGTRSPQQTTEVPTAKPDLRQALIDLRQAPPDLQGKPMPRPNELASEPGPGPGGAR